MKRTFTLGLMVFFLGLFITACGSKKSSSPATTNTTNTTNNNSGFTSIDTLPNGTTDCTNGCTRQRTLVIADQDAFAYMAGINQNNNNNYNGLFGSNPVNYNQGTGFNFNFGNTIAGGLNCLVDAGIGLAINKWLGGNVEGFCGTSTTQTYVNGQPISIASSYPMNIDVYGNANGVTGWTGSIGLNNGHNGYTFDLVPNNQGWLVDRYTNSGRPAIGVRDNGGRLELHVYQNNSTSLVGYIQ